MHRWGDGMEQHVFNVEKNIRIETNTKGENMMCVHYTIIIIIINKNTSRNTVVRSFDIRGGCCSRRAHNDRFSSRTEQSIKSTNEIVVWWETNFRRVQYTTNLKRARGARSRSGCNVRGGEQIKRLPSSRARTRVDNIHTITDERLQSVFNRHCRGVHE